MFDKCSYVHQKDRKTEKIEFLVRKIVELNADIVILKTNFHIETKILVKQVIDVNTSVSDIQKKPENSRKVNNNSTVTENIARIAKRCPENITSVVKLLFPKK